MKQRQCRHVAHMPSIFEPVTDSYGGGKSEAPHRCAGLTNLFCQVSCFTAGHPAAAGHLDLAFAGHLAAADHLDPASADHPAAVGHPAG